MREEARDSLGGAIEEDMIERKQKVSSRHVILIRLCVAKKGNQELCHFDAHVQYATRQEVYAAEHTLPCQWLSEVFHE